MVFVKPKRIEIVRTNLPGLSSLSQASCDAIEAVLRKRYIVRATTINSIDDLDRLILRQPDLVFLGIKYLLDSGHEKLWVSGYLEKNHIAHTGSSMNAVRLEQSKQLAKQQIAAAGLKTANFMVVSHRDPVIIGVSLNFPLFVKPTSLGSGQGIDDGSVVYTTIDLQNKITSLAGQYTSDILVEEYLPGREFSVAILKEETSDRLIAMPLELVAPLNPKGHRILGRATKSADLETVLSVTDNNLRSRVVTLAKDVFVALGARDYGRIDIRLDEAGMPHFLEANLIPSLLKGYGNFPKACLLNASLDYEEMILRIARLGLARAGNPIVVKSNKLPRAVSAL